MPSLYSGPTFSSLARLIAYCTPSFLSGCCVDGKIRSLQHSDKISLLYYSYAFSVVTLLVG